ncbi:putative proteasome endopeptidase complex [Helianthus anomalus]
MMMLPGSNRRIHLVHRHSRMGVAGLATDGRQIVARAKSESHNYERLSRFPVLFYIPFFLSLPFDNNFSTEEALSWSLDKLPIRSMFTMVV